MYKTCPVCGKSFVPDNETQLVCSRQCSGYMTKLDKEAFSADGKCKVCGRNSKYEFCSLTCKKAYITNTHRRELYEYPSGLGTADRIRLWHSEGMTPEYIAWILSRDIKVVREVLGLV